MCNQIAVRKVLSTIQHSSLPLVNHLRCLQPFQLIYNPGNAGDGLIASGTRVLFNYYNLEYIEVKNNTIIPGLPVVYGSGGGFCNLFNKSVSAILKASAVSPYILVMPSTFEPKKIERLRNLSNIFLYGRDYESMDIACRAGFQSEYSPDPAFWNRLPSFSACGGKGTLLAFRRDANRTDVQLEETPPGNIIEYDYSKDGNHYSGDWLINKICQYDTVHTDRLHVAIIAAMVGCETILYPNGNNYHKNMSLYHSTLSLFPNCRLPNRMK